jgi:hypothetical protein
VTSNESWYQVGHGLLPEVMIDLVDANGAEVTVGVTVPGFDAGAVAACETLDVDFESESGNWGVGWGTRTRLRIERAGQLVVAVGKNDPVGLPVGMGDSECYWEGDLCGYEEFALNVEAPGTGAMSIPNSVSAQVGDLMVTNDQYRKYYDTSGGCNFGLSVDYLVAAARVAAP